ncbi:MAG: DUF5677 domain-containing protein [Ignavibacteriaceae bacterium]
MENNDGNINKTLQYYNEELNKYKSIALPGIQKLIEVERAPYLKQLNALNDIYIFQNYLLDYQQIFFNKPINKTITLFFAKVASDLFSIRQCLMVGQLISASSIGRNVFETYVDTRVVLENDTEERSKLYENYQYIQLWLRIVAYKKYLHELEIDTNISEEKKIDEINYYKSLYKDVGEEEIKNNFEKVKKDYHPKYPFHWAWKIYREETKDKQNPKLDFICKRLGIYNDYLHVYSTNSLAVHNQPFMANFMTREGSITSVPIFSEITNSIAGISASLVIKIIMLVLEYTKSVKAEDVRLFLNNLFKQSFID